MAEEHNKGTKEFQELSLQYGEHLFGKMQCMSCANYLEAGKCKAFDRIPSAILDGTHDHTKPYPGDHGVRYEKKAD